MKKINDDFYINLNTVCVMQFTNGKYIASLSNGKQLNLTADSYNVLAEEFVDYKINDNLYINPNNISAICYANGKYTTYLSNGNNIGIDVTAFDILKVKLESCKVNDNLYVNPQYIIDTTVLQHPSNEDYIITLNNGVKLEVTADAYSSIAEMEAESFGGKVLINNSKTVVPNSGYLNEVYFNTSLSIEEVVEQLSKLNYVAVDGGYSVYGLFATTSGSHCLTVMTMEGVYVIFDISTDEVYFSNIDVSETRHAGWSPLASSPMVINEEITNNMEGITSGDQNDVLKDLIYVPGTDVELEGEYDGASVSVTENGTFDIQNLIQNSKHIPLKVNVDIPLPTVIAKSVINSNTTELYVNTSMSIEEVENILNSLSLVSETQNQYYDYFVINGNAATVGVQYVLGLSRYINDGKTTHQLGLMTASGQIEFYSTENGFNQNIIYPYIVDFSNGAFDLFNRGNLGKIVDILYTQSKTSLEGEYKFNKLTITENGTIDLSEEVLSNNKIVSSVDVDVKVKLLGGVGCAAIPTSGTIEKLYINSSLTIEEVQNLLEQIEFQTYTYLYFFAKNTDEKGYYVWHNKSGDGTWYIRNSDGLILYKYNNSITFSDFNGWNPDVIYPVTVNYELIDTYTGTDIIGVKREYKVGYDNERLKILVSTTPFEELEDNILSGEYEKEKISITENGSVDLLSHITDENKIPVEVEVNIPLPKGEIEITENGTYDVTAYETANVNIPLPEGEIEITENGTYDVTAYKSVNVNTIINMLQNRVDSSCGCSYLFYNYNDTTSIDFLDGLDTSNVTDMSHMFEQSTIRIVPDLDTSNVTNMSYMFHNSEVYRLPEFDTSNVIYMSHTFDSCVLLTAFPEWDTSNVIDMSFACYGAYGLETVPELNTSKVRDMSCLFCNCTKLNSIYGIDMRSVTDMVGAVNMFADCSSLVNLKITNVQVELRLFASTLLSLESLVSLCQECVDTGNDTLLNIGDSNVAKLANIYVKLTGEEEEDEMLPKLPMIQCESTDEGAMLISDYMTLKNWTIE